MRKPVLSLVPLVFLACQQEPTAPSAAPAPNFRATSTVTRASFFADNTLFIACLEEYVRFHGEVPYVQHQVARPSGDSLFTIQFVPVTPVTPPFVAEAQTSGTVYVYKNGQPINQVFVVGPGQVITIVDREVYVADNGDQLRLSFRQHLTVNANGEVTVDRSDAFEFECVIG